MHLECSPSMKSSRSRWTGFCRRSEAALPALCSCFANRWIRYTCIQELRTCSLDFDWSCLIFSSPFQALEISKYVLYVCAQLYGFCWMLDVIWSFELNCRLHCGRALVLLIFALVNFSNTRYYWKMLSCSCSSLSTRAVCDLLVRECCAWSSLFLIDFHVKLCSPIPRSKLLTFFLFFSDTIFLSYAVSEMRFWTQSKLFCSEHVQWHWGGLLFYSILTSNNFFSVLTFPFLNFKLQIFLIWVLVQYGIREFLRAIFLIRIWEMVVFMGSPCGDFFFVSYHFRVFSSFCFMLI